MRRAALVGGVLALLVGVAGFLVAPHYLRPFVEQLLSEKLHRKVSIGELSVNPYALSVSVKHFVLKEPDGSGDAARFDELYVNLEAESIFRAAPVVGAI
ncbi:MAG: hypothetical protein HGA47_12500, partial [Zoogloea sp.]|nr:hypothetical protein [Zoogloea sp.]